jgi:hypothetical protein
MSTVTQSHRDSLVTQSTEKASPENIEAPEIWSLRELSTAKPSL